jgi:speckle-type POZ protein
VQEKSENAISLCDDDSSTVEAMIHHMYGFDYNSSGNESRRVSPMLFNVKVYHIADKYDVPELKKAAKEKFETTVKACWQMDDFPVAISEVYKGTLETDRGLRDPIVTMSTEHIDQLQEDDGFRRVLESTARFAADLALNLAQRNVQGSKTTKYRCPSCNSHWLLERTKKVQCCPSCGSSWSNWSAYIVHN